MAKREALQELQSRIARLLQQASADTGVTASWLGVRIAGQPVLLPLQQSGEIYAMTLLQPLPYAKPWFLGVAALRGNIYGVIDLTPFLPASARQPQGRAPDADRQRLVAVNDALGLNVVLRVDSLEGLRGRDAFERSEPAVDGAPVYFGSRFHDAAGTMWQEINLQALAGHPDFLDIATDFSLQAPAPGAATTA